MVGSPKHSGNVLNYELDILLHINIIIIDGIVSIFSESIVLYFQIPDSNVVFLPLHVALYMYKSHE